MSIMFRNFQCRNCDLFFILFSVGAFIYVLTFLEYQRKDALIRKLSDEIPELPGLPDEDYSDYQELPVISEKMTSYKSKKLTSGLGRGLGQYPTPQQLFNHSAAPEFDKHMDAFDLPKDPIEFLPNYKNPCWFEEARPEDAYKANFYSVAGKDKHAVRFQEAYSRMKTILDLRKNKAGMSWRIRCLPYFYIAGFSRSGSTDIMNALLQHPHILPGFKKEVIYWNRVRLFNGFRSKGPLNTPHNSKYSPNREVSMTPAEAEELSKIPRKLNHYLESFDFQSEIIRTRVEHQSKGYHQMVFGDATPSYMWDFDVWRELDVQKDLKEPLYVVADYIASLTPDAKIVVTMRNPVDRIFSDFRAFDFYPMKTSEEFHRVTVQSINEFQSCLKKQSLRSCLYLSHGVDNLRLRIGIYYIYLQDWFEVFPKNQMFTMIFEDYAANTGDYLQKMLDFLELPRFGKEDLERVVRRPAKNAANTTIEMNPKTRSLLEEFYRPYNEKLSQLLERKLW